MFNRKCDHAKHIDEQRDELRRLRVKLEETQDELDKLRSQHTQLRGAVYAKKLHKPDDDDGAKPKSKAEFLRERFTPGKPARHDP